ncbi:hypothetical protein Hanom_Chr01g00022351 [Helianthus anomalus]
MCHNIIPYFSFHHQIHFFLIFPLTPYYSYIKTFIIRYKHVKPVDKIFLYTLSLQPTTIKCQRFLRFVLWYRVTRSLHQNYDKIKFS